MPDPNTIALVSVIGATSTAIAVPLINGYFQGRADRQRYEHERKATDLDELRELLDASAATAFKFTNKLLTLERLAARDDARGSDRYHELAAMRTELYNANARLVIRLGRQTAALPGCTPASVLKRRAGIRGREQGGAVRCLIGAGPPSSNENVVMAWPRAAGSVVGGRLCPGHADSRSGRPAAAGG